MPLRARRNKKAPAGKTTQIASVPETSVQEGGDVTRHSVSFVVPLMSARPSSSTADPPSLFATHHVPEDQAGAAKEAICQAGVMMEQVKAIRDASQAAYDASSALQSNVQVSRFTACSVRIFYLKNLFSKDLYIYMPSGCVY